MEQSYFVQNTNKVYKFDIGQITALLYIVSRELQVLLKSSCHYRTRTYMSVKDNRNSHRVMMFYLQMMGRHGDSVMRQVRPRNEVLTSGSGETASHEFLRTDLKIKIHF